MAEDKYFSPDEDSAYGDGILVDEYNGSYSLVAARQKQDGKVWMEWVFPQKRDGSKTPMDKSFPLKIKIGNSKEEAAARLRELAEKIDSSPF